MATHGRASRNRPRAPQAREKISAPQARENFSTSSAAAERPRLRPAGGRSAGRRAIDLELDAVPVENDA